MFRFSWLSSQWHCSWIKTGNLTASIGLDSRRLYHLLYVDFNKNELILDGDHNNAKVYADRIKWVVLLAKPTVGSFFDSRQWACFLFVIEVWTAH